MNLGTTRWARAAVILAVALPAVACSGKTGTAGPGHGSATAAPSVAAAPAPPFPVAENKRPGTSAWRITDLGADDAIEGYADRQSVLPGQGFRLYVSTTATSFRVDAFRFGWYSGHQARLVWDSAPVRGRQGPDGLPSDRGYAVSFDRPYDGDGAVRFLAFDEAAIALAEHTGVPLAYETDVDIDQHPGILDGARAVISLGHDQCYSLAMRNALMNARNAGTNLACLGANTIYRHIRFADGDRVIICYKVASLDPLFGQGDADTTQQWRDPPDARPESVITGVLYECNPVSAPWVVYDPSSWIFAGTGAYKGESWVCALRGPSCGHGLNRAAERFVGRATQNLLRAFAAGPAGRAHPARDNLAQVKPPRIPALYDGID